MQEGKKREIVVEFLVELGSTETSVTSDKSAHSPPLACEQIVDLYLKNVDRSLIRENLRLSYTERLLRLQRNAQAANEIRGAGTRALRGRR
jgi:hypothetical protein